MRFLLEKGWILAAVVLMFACPTAWASPVGTLTCTAASSGSSVTAQVSWYNVTVQDTSSIGTASGGNGAGRVTFSPVELHVSLSKFSEFLPFAETGKLFQQCQLVALAPNGVTSTYTFSPVAVVSVSAVASSSANGDHAAAYTDVQLQYGTLGASFSNAVDDGGVSSSN